MPLSTSLFAPTGLATNALNDYATMSAQRADFVDVEPSEASSEGPSSPRMRNAEPPRPANQQEWTDDDVRRLARDREHMQAVRDLYMISNPQQFPHIFADPTEHGQERVTPGNLLVGNRDAEFYGEPYVDPDTRNGPVEVIEMHQSRNYNGIEAPHQWNVDPNNPHLVYDDDSDNDNEENEYGLWWRDRAEASFYGPVNRRDIWDDESDMGDDWPREWNEAEYATQAEAVFAEINRIYWALPEGQRRAFYEHTDQAMVALMYNENQRRWRQELARDVVSLLADAEDARDEEETERRRERRHREALDQAWDEQQNLERELRDVGPGLLAPIEQDCHTASESFDAEEPEMYAHFRAFGDAVDRAAKTMVRRSDMYTWFPWLPQEFRNCLEKLSHHYRREACIKLRLKSVKAFQQERQFQPDPMDEEDWAGMLPTSGRCFGYEDERTTNGFADFISPDMALPVDEVLEQIKHSHFLRMCRVTAARLRLGPEGAHWYPSDRLVGAQYLSWQHAARKYLVELAELIAEEVAEPEEPQRKILAVITGLETAEIQVYQEWRANAEQSEG